MFQGSAQGFTFTRDSSKIVLSGRGDVGRRLRLGWIRGHLEGSTGRESSVLEGFSNSNDGESGQDQAGVWWHFDRDELVLTMTSGSIVRL